jgi:hypothetical protein
MLGEDRREEPESVEEAAASRQVAGMKNRMHHMGVEFLE